MNFEIKKILNKRRKSAFLTIAGKVTNRSFALRFKLRFAQPFFAKLKWTFNWSLSLRGVQLFNVEFTF